MGILVLLLSVSLASAPHNAYDPLVDLNRANFFDRGLYFGALSSLGCIDLNEFYAYADSDPFDSWNRDDIERYLTRLSYSDYIQFANENPSDRFRVSDIDELEDFRCSDRNEFNRFADQNRGDRFDRDDYYRLYGYDSADQFYTANRHFPYERSSVNVNQYVKDDGNGGFASSVRSSDLNGLGVNGFRTNDLYRNGYNGYGTGYNYGNYNSYSPYNSYYGNSYDPYYNSFGRTNSYDTRSRYLGRDSFNDLQGFGPFDARLQNAVTGFGQGGDYGRFVTGYDQYDPRYGYDLFGNRYSLSSAYGNQYYGPYYTSGSSRFSPVTSATSNQGTFDPYAAVIDVFGLNF